ncbi:hypothetical protein EJ03DRAFT_347927 [Teratosphaeria nubilosa]|uniref:Uncharacterized protein n=1 Tax=Teratosphaeria nubilosa TaxID=161662 RepID=A0A6G1LLI3_9PEZI|nr:hypothetical protein EJ03DRAFT_347927 [Teratosphaeria nubilosa]
MPPPTQHHLLTLTLLIPTTLSASILPLEPRQEVDVRRFVCHGASWAGLGNYPAPTRTICQTMCGMPPDRDMDHCQGKRFQSAWM